MCSRVCQGGGDHVACNPSAFCALQGRRRRSRIDEYRKHSALVDKTAGFECCRIDPQQPYLRIVLFHCQLLIITYNRSSVFSSTSLRNSNSRHRRHPRQTFESHWARIAVSGPTDLTAILTRVQLLQTKTNTHRLCATTRRSTSFLADTRRSVSRSTAILHATIPAISALEPGTSDNSGNSTRRSATTVPNTGNASKRMG